MSQRIVDTGAAEASLKLGVHHRGHARLPRCFALAPLYGHLVTRQVDIRLLSGGGTLDDAFRHIFLSATDAEVLARQLLGDLDRFLAASTSAEFDDPAGLGVLRAKAIDVRHTIASGIVHQLQSVFDYAADEIDADFQNGLQQARDMLMQQLQISLTKGYDTPVIVQPDRYSPTSSAEPSLATRIDADQDMQRAPMPLRVYPESPSIRSQTASPTFDSPTGLQDLSLWTCQLVLAHPFAAQDTVVITTEFNLPGDLLQQCTFTQDADLFSALVQYVMVAGDLWKLLGTGLDAKPAKQISHVNAATTFVDLAAAVAAHWNVRLPQNKSSSLSEGDWAAKSSQAFGVRVGYSADGGDIESVSVTGKQPQAEPTNALPGIAVLGPDGVGVAFLAQASDQASATTVFLPVGGRKVPALAQQTLLLALNSLNVSARQNARSRVIVVRNEDLLYDPLHPGNPGPRTNPVFLLQSAEVVARSQIAPLIDRNDLQEITGRNLQASLEDAIQKLFPPNDIVPNTVAAWQLDYSYEVTVNDASPSNNPTILVRIPVVSCPPAPLAGIAPRLANEAQRWIDACQPAHDKAGWILSVTLYSGIESSMRPLFSANLFYRIV